MFVQPSRLTACLLVLSLTGLNCAAYDLKGVAIHGSLSGTAAYSDRYDYYGATARSADVVVTEGVVNGTYSFPNGLRLAAQLYAYRLNDYQDLTIDFANANYQFNRSLALNVGRLKRPLGFYSTAQDIDQIRPMAFLPLDFYPKTFRPVGNAIDGASFSGRLSAGRVGSFEYEAYLGRTPGYDPDTPFSLGVNDPAPFLTKSVDTKGTWGGVLSWNTPVEGLRFGAGYMDAKLSYGGVAKTTAQLAISPTESRFLPIRLPAGVWESAVAGQRVTSDIVADYSTVSAEYTRGAWQFTAEYLYIRRYSDTVLPVLGLSRALAEQDSRYAMVTYELSDRWQFGTYYCESNANINDRQGRKNVILPGHRNWLKDFALAASCKVTPAWMVKAEIHSLNGTKTILSTTNGDAAKWSPDWAYYVIKSTYSF